MSHDEESITIQDGRGLIRVPAAMARPLVAEAILVQAPDGWAVSEALHRDSVLAVLLALGARRTREAVVV